MMRAQINLKIAWRSLINYKLRSILAILGVFLGSFSLIVVSNLAGALKIKTQLEVEKLGKDLLIVRSGQVRRFGSAVRLVSDATNLTVRDAQTIASSVSLVERVSPSSNKTFPIRYRGVALSSILVTGVMPNYPETRNVSVQDGTFITEQDNTHLAKVAVLGKTVARKLFGEGNPIGQYIFIYRVPCLVIGVMEEKGSDLAGVDQDNQVFLPLQTYLRRFVNQDFINTIYVQLENGLAVASAKADIEELIRRSHRIKPGQKDDFTVIDMKDVAQLKNQAISMITTLGRISATVSFLIGGIGILSIMILIVNERRVEIGIRRAVGSRKRDIVLQFLMESSVISFTGGLAGVILGMLTSILIYRLTALPFQVSLAGLLLAFLASVVVGGLAGIYPSQKATAIQPVDVIRS
ncbi:MAG TPA: ABC transporter permease [Syntrophobacteraceae bacterium]|nr:ABC transporter permease [Syntrophobacteraceae bacterium]